MTRLFRFERRWSACWLYLLACCCSGCREKATPPALASTSASASSGASPARPPDDEISPVYSLDAGSPLPEAARFCDAIHGTWSRRRAECCSEAPNSALEDQCVRMTTLALRSGAAKIEASDLERCSAAAARAHEGCGWVGEQALPLPVECRGILRGTLGEDAVCRSSIECADGRHCRGISATSPGRCAAPAPAGAPCGTGIDPLAALARQHDVEARECAGYCARPRCQARVPAGGACKSGLECGAGASCRAGACRNIPPPKLGESCAETECGPDTTCSGGVCRGAARAGEPCSADAECLGRCERSDAGSAGRCAMRCSVALDLSKALSAPSGLEPRRPAPKRRP